MKTQFYYVYILTTRNNSVTYTGITNNIVRRVAEHKLGKTDGFTKKYNINKLIYIERYEYVEDAIAREKQIKKYSRAKKLNLINTRNPTLKELNPYDY